MTTLRQREHDLLVALENAPDRRAPATIPGAVHEHLGAFALHVDIEREAVLGAVRYLDHGPRIDRARLRHVAVPERRTHGEVPLVPTRETRAVLPRLVLEVGALVVDVETRGGDHARLGRAVELARHHAARRAENVADADERETRDGKARLTESGRLAEDLGERSRCAIDRVADEKRHEGRLEQPEARGHAHRFVGKNVGLQERPGSPGGEVPEHEQEGHRGHREEPRLLATQMQDTQEGERNAQDARVRGVLGPHVGLPDGMPGVRAVEVHVLEGLPGDEVDLRLERALVMGELIDHRNEARRRYGHEDEPGHDPRTHHPARARNGPHTREGLAGDH
ncbi:hypothetical protein B7O87_14350 [Cylindrospermopsis raciborskii CENA303]|uniref:Uncharacterized protein n=1 Tax=Cylindrospermopsis raciborskii CENA303 TaxID=1170769 RepID=A0A1X4G3N1_9CYAN|nr:hypothetical protein B7O87_14350 [Cylindrospermopsis raciborskii CENA303]